MEYQLIYEDGRRLSIKYNPYLDIPEKVIPKGYRISYIDNAQKKIYIIAL